MHFLERLIKLLLLKHIGIVLHDALLAFLTLHMYVLCVASVDVDTDSFIGR